MTPEDANPVEPVWEALSLRLTAFTVEPTPADQKWWKSVMGEDPEETSSKKATLERKETGQFEGGVLALTIDPVRVNWQLHPLIEKGEMVEGQIPTLGPFVDLTAKFRELMDRWLPDCPPIKRLAFGAVLNMPMLDRDSSYRKLDDLLEHVHVDPESRDFQYRVNRRRPSGCGIPNLQINRLATWSCVEWRVQISVLAGGQSADVPPLAGRFANRLEVDINTAPDFDGELPRDRLSSLFRELADFGGEIASHGDVA